MRAWCAIVLLLAAPLAACSAEPPRASTPAAQTAIATLAEALTLTGQRVDLPIPLDLRARERIARALTHIDPRALTVRFEGISWERSPGFHYEVYINLSPGGSPDSGGPHYVGNLSFYGAWSGEKDRIEELSLLQPLRELARRGHWKQAEPLALTLGPGGLLDADGRPAPPETSVPAVSIRRVLMTVGPEV